MSSTPLTSDELARLVARVADMELAESDREGTDRLRHFEELKGAIAARQMREAVALADERVADDAARAVPRERQGRGAAGEIGLARRISPNQAQRWLGLARVLPTELPATFALLSRGVTTEWRALLVAKETIFLSRAHRAIVDAQLAPRLASLGDRRVEAEARRLAQGLDPAGAAERARTAATHRRVTMRPAPDTMVRLSLLLPVHQGVAGYAALRKHADALIAIGAQGTNPDGTLRTRDQIMADTAVERLTGQAVANDIPVEINLIMTDTALFAATDSTDTDPATADEPAILLGYGPISAPLARELALGQKRGASHADSGGRTASRWIRRLYLTPDGRRLAAMDSARREFTENQRRFIRLRDHDTCRTPWCDAPIRHLDHVQDHARGGPTSVANGQGYCVACNHTKQAAGWRTVAARDGTIQTVTPTGHSYDSTEPMPPGARAPTPSWVARRMNLPPPGVLVDLRFHAQRPAA